MVRVIKKGKDGKVIYDKVIKVVSKKPQRLKTQPMKRGKFA